MIHFQEGQMKKGILAIALILATGRAHAIVQAVSQAYREPAWNMSGGVTIYQGSSIGVTLYRGGDVGVTLYQGSTVGATILTGSVGATIYGGSIGVTLYRGSDVGVTLYRGGDVGVTLYRGGDVGVTLYRGGDVGVTLYRGGDVGVTLYQGSTVGATILTGSVGATIYGGNVTATAYVTGNVNNNGTRAGITCTLFTDPNLGFSGTALHVWDESLKAAMLSATATAASDAACTLSLAAVAGNFHYVAGLRIYAYATGVIPASATPITVTSTNFGSRTWIFPNEAAKADVMAYEYQFAYPPKSTTVNTATTIVCPAVTNIIWSIQAEYFTAQ